MIDDYMENVQNDSNEIVTYNSSEIIGEIRKLDFQILTLLELSQLPTENVFVDIEERRKVFQNLASVLNLIPESIRLRSLYLSKFIAAVTSGLFDAALNYLWDETISQLRLRVAVYDIEFFLDNALDGSSIKRNQIRTEDDLSKLSDSELIKGCRDIGLISSIGYQTLDHIKYMRNWASAAHPNQTSLRGLQLVDWLETCVLEVICLPETQITVQVRKLLTVIKERPLDSDEANSMAHFFIDLEPEKAKSLVNGFFGIYTRDDTEEHARTNIKILLPKLWGFVDRDTKVDLGVKYAQFMASGQINTAKKGREFLSIVDGEQYIPDTIRASEIMDVLDSLVSAHDDYNNFYSEPPFARLLISLTGENKVPKEIEKRFATDLVYVFISNGNGVCWDAEAIYRKIISQFNQRMSFYGLMTFLNADISSKLQFSLCQKKYKEFVELISPQIVSTNIKEFVELVNKTPNEDLKNLKDNQAVRKRVEAMSNVFKS